MLAMAKERSDRIDSPAREIARILEDHVASSVDVTPRDGDPAAARRRSAEVIAHLAGGRREPVEELRLHYLRRLHRASDDFGATEGLRVVETALTLMPRPEDPATEQRRARQRRWRWRRRRRGIR